MLLSVLAITSCNNIVPVLNSEIEIRLKNVSDEKLEDLTLLNVEYGSLRPGKTSDYKSFEYFETDGTHVIAFCESNVNDESVSNGMIIYCGTGLDILDPGKYTIEVDYEASEKGYSGLTLTLVE